MRPWMTAAEIAFGSGAIEDEDWERERQALPAARAHAAFDGGKPVALAGAYRFDLTIPGGELPCAASHGPSPGRPVRLSSPDSCFSP